MGNVGAGGCPPGNGDPFHDDSHSIPMTGRAAARPYISHLISSLSALWLDPKTPFRKNAVSALQVSTGFTQDQIESALDAVFGEITTDVLNAFLVSNPSVSQHSLTTLHIAAGNVFTAWLHGAVFALLLGHRVWIKPSSHEPVFAALWRQSLIEQDPAFEDLVRVVSWDDALIPQVDVVIAYGSDQTLETLKKKFPGTPFAGYGHKISAAIVFADALQENSPEIENAWRDIDAFDLQGCLSPQVIYVEGDSAVLEEAIRARKPQGPLPRWKTFNGLEEVWKDLQPVDGYLSCVGVAGAAGRREAAAHFAARPEVRVCRLGAMQRPPLDWRNGGVHLPDVLNLAVDHSERRNQR